MARQYKRVLAFGMAFLFTFLYFSFGGLFTVYISTSRSILEKGEHCLLFVCIETHS